MCGIRVDSSGTHEINGVLNTVRKLAIFLGFWAIRKAKCPRMDALHVRETAGRKRTQQIQRSSRLCISLQHARRIGNASLGREIQTVDDVTTVARQFNTTDCFGVGAARLGELTSHTANFNHRYFGTEGQNHRHLQHYFKSIADAIGIELVKGFGTIAAL